VISRSLGRCTMRPMQSTRRRPRTPCCGIGISEHERAREPFGSAVGRDRDIAGMSGQVGSPPRRRLQVIDGSYALILDVLIYRNVVI